MKRLLASTLFALLPTSVLAGNTCSIEVDGLLYHYGECRYSETLSSDGSLSIEIGQKAEGESLGYWVLLLEDSDGKYQGHWNGSYGGTRTHNYLYEMKKEDDCWVGENSRICLGVPVSDLPTYRILEGDHPVEDNTVEANVNGTRYVIDHESWEQVGPYRIGETVDLDGDGFPETLVHLFNGGNCCPGEITILSYRGEGFFEVVNDEPIPNGWHGSEIVKEDSEYKIRISDSATGFGNYEDWRSQTDYALRDGQVVKITERRGAARRVSLIEVTAEEVRDLPSQKKSLSFDIDLDGKPEIIDCRYWGRWGSLSCDIRYSRTGETKGMSCKSFAVFPEVKDDALVLRC